MDTFKDRQILDDVFNRGDAPWEVWKTSGNTPIDVTREDVRPAARLDTSSRSA
jgi:hypothetical protein